LQLCEESLQKLARLGGVFYADGLKGISIIASVARQSRQSDSGGGHKEIATSLRSSQ